MPQRPELLSLNPHGLDDILNDIERIGQTTRREREAEALIIALRSRMAAIKTRAVQAARRPRVACVEWFDPLYAAGHWVPEMVALAGGRDILGRAGEPSAKFAWTQLLDLEPEVLVLMACGFDLERNRSEAARLTKSAGWNDLPAVKDTNVFIVDGNAYFSRPGPRLFDGLELLAQMIHPELFCWRASLDAAEKLSI
jgi:iron complex transport system substrate-binding protein